MKPHRAQVIRDKRVLHLIGQYLRSGMMVEGVVIATQTRHAAGRPAIAYAGKHLSGPAGPGTGTARASVLPGYADDCNIYVSSEAAAQRSMASIQHWIKRHLRLQL